MSNQASEAKARIEALLDASSFVEIGAGVTARNTDFNLSLKKAPSDGVVTGYGRIEGRLVYIYSQDPDVLGGTVGEMHARKIVNIYKLALKIGVPVIGLIDCGGMRLEEAADGLFAFGEIYHAMSEASGVIPQITAVYGKCGGGMALIPAMADFSLMVTDGQLFVNSPDAMPGNSADKLDTASCHFQSEEAGNVDFAGTKEEVAGKIRELVAILPENNEDDMGYLESNDDPNRESADLDRCAKDPMMILARIADDGKVIELKKDYGPDMVTALFSLNGNTVGAVANRSASYKKDGTVDKEYGCVISARGAEKAAKFVRFLDAFSIPLVTFTNVEGFKASVCGERRIAGRAAQLAYSFTDATTPKINVITGKAFGSAALVMNSKSTGADMVYAWEGTKVGMMDAKEAAKLMNDTADAKEIKTKAAEYDELQNSVASAAARGYVDTVINPAETRKYLIGTIDMLYTKREARFDKKHGTV
ncbi:MAG: carboxyl transferase domain-containing protein [Eubacterium sp.]|nr:carboxyl transferase domain-containing protein [Eubacterium sp.]